MFTRNDSSHSPETAVRGLREGIRNLFYAPTYRSIHRIFGENFSTKRVKLDRNSIGNEILNAAHAIPGVLRQQ